MGATNIFQDKDEIEQICKEYLQGKSPQELANKYYCSRPTIRNYLIANGIELRSKKIKIHDKDRPRAMILHDWNANVDSRKLMKTYKFDNINSLHCYIKRMRNKGYNFKSRIFKEEGK